MSPPVPSLVGHALVALCAWGVLAFAAVYPWAYRPLAGGAAVLSAMLLVDRRVRAAFLRQPLLVPLACVFAAIALQLVPVPAKLLHAVSPSTPALLLDYSLSYSLNPGIHPLSIDPDATRMALVLGSCWALLLLVTASWLGVAGVPRHLVVGLAGLGLVVALVGIVQRPFFSGSIYGFWEPVQRGISFGPFVNRNHFAGWMAMSLPLTLGLVCARLARASGGGARTWRDHLAWVSGPQGSGLVLLMMAAMLMSLALALSGSRSGALCLLFAAFATVQVLARRQEGRRRGVAIAYVVGVVLTTLVWLGPAALAQAYDRPWEEWPDIGGRVGVWQDAMSVAAAFPLAGTGLNTYGSAMLFYQRHDLFYHYTAAHNDYLQVAAEGGLLVGIPVAWALLTLVRTIRRRFHDDVAAGRAGVENYWVRVGAVTGLTAIGLQEMFDFSLQLPGNIVMFAVLCAIAIHRAPEAGRALRPART